MADGEQFLTRTHTTQGDNTTEIMETGRKKKHVVRTILIVLLVVLVVLGIGVRIILDKLNTDYPVLSSDTQIGQWYKVTPEGAKSSDGSFTTTDDKIYSHDNLYYALITVEGKMIEIVIFSDKDEKLCSIMPCRKSDFWGVCWESDNHNLWIQSGDIGIVCYSMNNGVWEPNPNAVRPDNIISKYDK